MDHQKYWDLNNNQLHPNDRTLQKAAINGDTEEVRRLIPLSTPHVQKNNALMLAIQSKQVECVELLIPVSQNLHDNEALYYAIIYDQLDIFMLLLPHSNPKARNSQMLFECSRRNLLEYVKILLPLSDASAQNSVGLVHASMFKNQEMFDLLYPHCNIKQALQVMAHHNIDDDQKEMLMTAHRAVQERKIIQSALPSSQNSIKKKRCDIINSSQKMVQYV